MISSTAKQIESTALMLQAEQRTAFAVASVTVLAVRPFNLSTFQPFNFGLL